MGAAFLAYLEIISRYKMRKRSLISGLALAASIAGAAAAQPQNQLKASPDEQKAAQAIAAAADDAAKLKAATDFVRKYPKSALRPQVAHAVANHVSAVKDATQKATLAHSYSELFKEPAEQELIVPVEIEALAAAKRPDEAFAVGTAHLAKSPDSLAVLVQLVATGADEAKKQNGKFVSQSIQYGTHAIEIIEGNKKPADVDDAGWTSYHTTVLPSLYQSVGLLNLIGGDRAKAKTSYVKASELAPAEPFNFIMLAGMVNDEYQNEAKRYQTMPSGAARDQELKKAQALLDAVIDAYAHAIAVSEGNATYQAVRQQYLQDFEAYYKYRHSNSTTGMQALIDKYKPTAKP
jgi:hypothetical protein